MYRVLFTLLVFLVLTGCEPRARDIIEAGKTREAGVAQTATAEFVFEIMTPAPSARVFMPPMRPVGFEPEVFGTYEFPFEVKVAYSPDGAYQSFVLAVEEFFIVQYLVTQQDFLISDVSDDKELLVSFPQDEGLYIKSGGSSWLEIGIDEVAIFYLSGYGAEARLEIWPREVYDNFLSFRFDGVFSEPVQRVPNWILEIIQDN